MSDALFADVGLVHAAIEAGVEETGARFRFRVSDAPFELRDFHASVERRIHELEETVRLQAAELTAAAGELAAERAARRRLRGRKAKTIELERGSDGAVLRMVVFEGAT